MKQGQPELFQFDEMTPQEIKAVWEGHRCFAWDYRMDLLDLPDRFAQAKLSDYAPEYQALAGQSVFITGPAGSGKTHLMAALARRQLVLSCRVPMTFDADQNEISFCRFISVTDLLTKFRETLNYSNERTEKQVFDDYAKCKYLYLDDLGVQAGSDWVSQIIYRVIDYRYSHMLPMVITSNLTLEEMSDEQSRRIASRIAGECKVITLGGRDLRHA